jgi:hypothetical protein
VAGRPDDSVLSEDVANGLVLDGTPVDVVLG